MPNQLLLSRRQLTPLAVAAAAVGSLGVKRAFAAAYPSQTITFLIPDGIGGGASTYVREFAALLSQNFNPPVNVEPYNDQGANGQKAVLDLARAAPDGYTIGMLGDVLSVKQDTDLLNKLTWIANLGRTSFGLAVNVKSGVNTVADLQKLGQQRPVTFASSGKTALSYFATQLFCKLNNIPYKIITGYKGAADSMVAVTRGEADATAQSLPTLRSMTQSGLLRTIFAYAKKSPLPGIEDATSINQPDLAEIVQWRFVAGPPGLPQPIVQTLAAGLKKVAADPATIAWSKKVHVPIYYLGPDEAKQAAADEVALYAKWQGKLG